MFVPFISPARDLKQLYRRKGGGGGGKSGGSSGGKTTSSSSSSKSSSSKKGSSSSSSSSKSSGSSSSSSKSSSSSSSSSKSSSSGSKSSISTVGTTKSATSYGKGGGKAITIPSGQLFAGRSAGGGTRGQVFGTRTYGSGYPGITGRGVNGRGFPFFFWPVVWGGAAGAGSAAYLHDNEYGDSSNSSRPGGAMMTAAFLSNSTNTTFRIVSDNTTVTALITDITANCSSSLSSSSSTTPSTFNESAPAPKPEQVIQYYRSSSVSLTLDGYNDTTALGDDDSAADVALPSNIDTTLLDCLNQTIGLAAPLIDGAAPRWASPNVGLIGLVWVLWCITSFF